MEGVERREVGSEAERNSWHAACSLGCTNKQDEFVPRAGGTSMQGAKRFHQRLCRNKFIKRYGVSYEGGRQSKDKQTRLDDLAYTLQL